MTGPRHTRWTPVTITYTYWLIFDRNGKVRLTREAPSVGRSERAMRVETKLPRSIFDTPYLKAKIDFPDPGDGYDSAIQAQVEVTEALNSVVGVDVDVRVVGSELGE